MSSTRDRDLGMFRDISRRDFVGAVAVGLGAVSVLGPGEAHAQSRVYPPRFADDAYPPALTGLRGAHAGSFETAHRMRDGAWR